MKPKTWCILEIPTCQPCQPCVFEDPNPFAAILPEDDSDDEDHVVAAVQQPDQIKSIPKKHADGQLQKVTPERFQELKDAH